MIGLGRWEKMKSSEESNWMSMKFPIALESMSAVVLMILFFPCSKIGKLMVLLLDNTTSTQFTEWEEDIETTSLLKNT